MRKCKLKYELFIMREINKIYLGVVELWRTIVISLFVCLFSYLRSHFYPLGSNLIAPPFENK